MELARWISDERFVKERARVEKLRDFLPKRRGISSHVEVHYMGVDEAVPNVDLRADDNQYVVALCITQDRGEKFPAKTRIGAAPVWFEIAELRDPNPAYNELFLVRLKLAIAALDEMFAEADQP